MQSVSSNAVAQALSGLIKYKDVSIDNLTIGSNGYVDVTSYIPSGMTNFLFAVMWNYGTVSSSDALGINANGTYVYGSGNAVISRIDIRYFYTD